MLYLAKITIIFEFILETAKILRIKKKSI